MIKNNGQPILTIGIPTYNRPDDLLRLLKQIEGSATILMECCVLVIDDSSNETTKSAINEQNLSADFIKNKLRYINNEGNIGYPRTFIKLIKECTTEYILILADDNMVFEDGFARAIKNIKLLHPSFMSSPWVQGGAIAHRTWKRGASDCSIGVADFFRSADHAPGLIYNSNKAKKYLSIIEKRISSGCSFTHVFPQVNLALNLLLYENNCHYSSQPIGTENSLKPSGIKDASGHDWRTYRSLLRQAADLDEFLSSISNHTEKKTINVAAQKYYLNYFLKLVEPEVEKFFQMSLTNKFLIKKPWSLIKYPFKLFFNFIRGFFKA